MPIVHDLGIAGMVPASMECRPERNHMIDLLSWCADKDEWGFCGDQAEQDEWAFYADHDRRCSAPCVIRSDASKWPPAFMAAFATIADRLPSSDRQSSRRLAKIREQ